MYIDKIVGDAVLLVIPGVDARASTLALLVARAVLQGNDIYAPSVGVHAGDVLLTDVGLPVGPIRSVAFEQVTVMGPVVNLAQRLASKAGGSAIALLGEAMDEFGVSPMAVSGLEAGLKPTETGNDNEILKGFRERPVRIRRLVPSSLMRPSAVDVLEMFDRVAEMGTRLPRIDVSAT